MVGSAVINYEMLDSHINSFVVVVVDADTFTLLQCLSVRTSSVNHFSSKHFDNLVKEFIATHD